jgi:hypothetical protein
MKRFFNLSLVVLFFMVTINMVHADVFMKQKKHTDPVTIMGQQQPASDETEEIWITGKGIRNDGPKGSMIMDLNGQKIYMLDHQKKTFMEMPMNMGQMMKEMTDQGQMEEKESEQAEAAMQGIQGAMQMQATVQAISESKKINNWNCKKYILTLNTFMGIVTSEIWASEDIKIDKDLYDKFTTGLMGMMPGMQGGMESMMKEMRKIKGVHVYTVSKTSMMGQTITSTTELLEFKDGSAPANLLKLPAGYKKMDFMSGEN